MQMLSIDAITLDERCQPRAAMSTVLVDEYADAMTQGAEFPPLTVYRDGDTWYLADGFHRIAAAEQAGQKHVVCDVRRGTIRDAILHAVGANATHGQRRTNLDKRRAVETLLNDPEWATWSNHEIGRRCAVSEYLVRSLRSDRSENQSEGRTYTDRYGNVRTMNTENIGKRREPLPAPDLDAGDDDYPEYEVVDPNDPETWMTEYRKQDALPKPMTPAPPPARPNLSRDYTVPAKRLADQIEADYGIDAGIRVLELAATMLQERFEV